MLLSLGNIYVAILLVIFGGIVLHAPLCVGLGTIWPDYSLLFKSWKEILMILAGLFLLVILYHKKQFKLMREPLILAIAIYAAMHLILLLFNNKGVVSILAGLMIDLRYLLYFSLVYFAVKLYPNKRRLFIKVGVIGALVVLVFALMQVFVLPRDVLKYIGYGKDTISPYLTVDQNDNYIRINSTLRGPNPLGAYAGMVLVMAFAAIIKRKINSDKRSLIIASFLIFGGLVALWASYSRSALVTTLAALTIIIVLTGYIRRLPAKLWLIIATILILMSGTVWAIKGTGFISNVFFHENPADINDINSNEGHINSLISGFDQMISQPIGAGVGSTGSASLYGDSPVVIENQYLFIAHEAGWMGLVLFISIFSAVLMKLWDKRRDWLALGVFSSGIALALIGLLLPVWVDDTVSIIWWGLAALAIAERTRVE